MAMTTCKECNAQVSDQATKCVNCGARLKKPKRGFFGKLAKWSLIGFNVLMVIWLFSYFGDVGEYINETESSAEQTGAAIGGTIGTGMILMVWVLGDIILGLWALLTRPRDLNVQ